MLEFRPKIEEQENFDIMVGDLTSFVFQIEDLEGELVGYNALFGGEPVSAESGIEIEINTVNSTLEISFNKDMMVEVEEQPTVLEITLKDVT